MSQGRSIIDIIKDPAALESFLRASSKSSSDSPNSQRLSTDSNRLLTSTINSIGNNIYNQNTTNNTNVQITQNTYNFNTNPSLLNPSTQQSIVSNDSTRVLNQTIGSQTNVNVILNQTVIQQAQQSSSTPTTTTTSTGNQQQMVAININGNQTLIPLSMFTKLLQQKYSNTSSPTTTTTTTTTTGTAQILQNGSTSTNTNSTVLPNSSPITTATTLRFVRPSTPSPTSNLMTINNNNNSGQRLSTPILSKPQTGNIIVQVTNQEQIQSKLLDKTSTNNDLTTQLMNDLQINGKDPEKQIALIDTYLSRMHSSTEKDLEFSKRIIRYRETLSQSVEQARINGQHRQRLLDQSTTLNTLSSNPSIKRELPSTVQTTTQQISNGTKLIQLPLAKQDELLNAVLKKLRHVNLTDLQNQGILPLDLSFEQKLQIQKLDMQIAALPIDKQQQFARGQRELVPKYLAKNAASGLNTTTTLTVNPRTKILLGAPPPTTNANAKQSLRISSADLIGQQLRKDQIHVLKPDFKNRFLTRGDAIKRLTRYHVLSKPAAPIYEPTEDECQQFDESFEIEARRLLNTSERINESISRFAIANDQSNNDSYDKYLFEKMRLDDLREQLEKEKTDYEIRKKRALDVDNRPIAHSLTSDQLSPLPSSSTYDFLSNTSNYNLAPAMSDADYNDLFNSDEPLRTIDETQLAINSIVECDVLESNTTTNTIDINESANFFFDDLDMNNPSQDDEASRAVQNLLGFS